MAHKKLVARTTNKIILDSAVGRVQMVQHIGLFGETEKIGVTFLVMRLFSVLPSESRGCVRCVRTTAESRIMGLKKISNFAGLLGYIID
jgi:hypothetical protein